MLKITINDTQEIEKFILINIVGLLESIQEDVISIDEAQIALFTPYSVSRLNDLSLSSELIELVEAGLLLEDFESVLPEKLNDHIIKMKIEAYRQMRHLISPQSEIKKWID